MPRDFNGQRPPLLLVLSLFSVIAMLQLPVATLIAHSARWGIVVNEVVILVALPLVALQCFGFRLTSIISWQHSSARLTGASLLLTVGTAVTLCYLLAASQHFIPLSPLMLRISTTPIAITGSIDYFFTLLLFCVVAPICEEILFRGLVQTTLTHRMGGLRACLFTAVFFALMHGNDWYPHLYFVLGCVLSWIYLQTGTLRTPILCHMMNNVIVLTMRQYHLSLPLASSPGMTDLMVIGLTLLLTTAAIISLARKAPAR